MKFRAALFFGGLIAATAAVGADDVGKSRFSQTLSVAEMTETGVKRLSTDQVAVLDALVRRDLGSQSKTRSTDVEPDATPTPQFSQRLTEDERRNAGIAVLSDAERARVDALVERNASAVSARTLLAPLRFVPKGTRLNPEQTKIAPEIHGTLSLSYGWGSGGYSEKTGGMTLRFEDPAHNLSINVGYSETHTTGSSFYRDYPVTSPLLP